jgi:hypothetical protein
MAERAAARFQREVHNREVEAGSKVAAVGRANKADFAADVFIASDGLAREADS